MLQFAISKVVSNWEFTGAWANAKPHVLPCNVSQFVREAQDIAQRRNPGVEANVDLLTIPPPTSAKRTEFDDKKPAAPPPLWFTASLLGLKNIQKVKRDGGRHLEYCAHKMSANRRDYQNVPADDVEDDDDLIDPDDGMLHPPPRRLQSPNPMFYSQGLTTQPSPSRPQHLRRPPLHHRLLPTTRNTLLLLPRRPSIRQHRLRTIP